MTHSRKLSSDVVESDAVESDAKSPERDAMVRRIPAAQAVAMASHPIYWNDLVRCVSVQSSSACVSEAASMGGSHTLTTPNVPVMACGSSEMDNFATPNIDMTSGRVDVQGDCFRERSTSAIPESVEATLMEIASALRKSQAEVRNAWEQQLFIVAVAMARKILQRELTRTTPISLEKIESILDFVVTCPEIRLTLHPDDLAAIVPFQETLRQSSCLEQIHWEADATVARGGCRLRWAYGSLEAGPEQELQRILEEWMPDES